jgi:hypothetical protein
MERLLRMPDSLQVSAFKSIVHGVADDAEGWAIRSPRPGEYEEAAKKMLAIHLALAAYMPMNR